MVPQDAISYYEKDLTLAKSLHDRVNMGRAYCNLGLSHMALGNLDGALECQKYFLAISQVSRNLQVRKGTSLVYVCKSCNKLQ